MQQTTSSKVQEMAVHTRRMTVEEFDHFATLPEHSDRRFEFIGGEMVEAVSNQRSSAIAYNIGFYIKLYLHEKGLGGIVTGADGGYAVSGGRYIPDVAYVSHERQDTLSDEAYSAIPPDLAVEVLSPTNEPDELRIKVVGFLNAGTAVWVVNPGKQRVEVYAPGSAPKTLGINETLDGGDVLPGFTLAVSAIFPAEDDETGDTDQAR
jgi:Uma2 family endonuclease